MPSLPMGRRGAAISVSIAGAAMTLLGVQQVAGTAASAQPVRNDLPAFEPITLAAPAPSVSSMNAAVSVGQFEEPVRPTPLPTTAPSVAPTAVPEPAPTEAPTPSVFETGIASTYGAGDGFEGNLTACGQIFRSAIIQVAHKSLPCGTIVRVEDSDTGSSVVAEVTDRGPYIPGRIVDLSWAAFKQLDRTAPGLLRVNVYLVDN